MKLCRLETHDRYEVLKKQSDYISEGLQDCKTKNSVGVALLKLSPYIYVFAHKKQLGLDERFSVWTQLGCPTWDKVPTDRLLWQPRLTKPEAEPNTMLFKVYPNNDTVKIIWMLPDRRLWSEYKKGYMTENEMVTNFIDDYFKNRDKLEAPEADDLSEEAMKKIYQNIGKHLDASDKIVRFEKI